MLPVVALDVLYPSPDASKPKAVKNAAASHSAGVGLPPHCTVATVANIAPTVTTATILLTLNVGIFNNARTPRPQTS